MNQVAVCRAPMNLEDLLAFASTPPGPARSADPCADPRSRAARGRDPADRPDLARAGRGQSRSIRGRPRWRSRNAAGRSRTCSSNGPWPMRLRRFKQRRGSYDDLLDMPRHFTALHHYDDIDDIAGKPSGCCRARWPAVAYLAEIRAIHPRAERPGYMVADLEARALVRRTGNLPQPRGPQLEAMHHQVQTRHSRSRQYRWPALTSAVRPRTARGHGGRGRGSGHRRRPLPGRPRHRRATDPPRTPTNAQLQRAVIQPRKAWRALRGRPGT